MDKIVCLVGPSGSGKTTLAKELEKRGCNVIHSYTTRPPRSEDEWGHTFMSEDEGVKASENMRGCGLKGVIAYQNLYGHHYWAEIGQYYKNGISIYVIDPKGAQQVRENVRDAKVITIALMCDEKTRIRRMFEDRTPEQIRERIARDRDIFSTIKCDCAIDANQTVDQVLACIEAVIR